MQTKTHRFNFGWIVYREASGCWTYYTEFKKVKTFTITFQNCIWRCPGDRLTLMSLGSGDNHIPELYMGLSNPCAELPLAWLSLQHQGQGQSKRRTLNFSSYAKPEYLSLLSLLLCSPAEHTGGHPVDATVHWQIHSVGWKDRVYISITRPHGQLQAVFGGFISISGMCFVLRWPHGAEGTLKAKN